MKKVLLSLVTCIALTTTYAEGSEKAKETELKEKPNQEIIDDDVAGTCHSFFWVIDPITGEVIYAFDPGPDKTETEQDCHNLVAETTLKLADAYAQYSFVSSATYE